MVPRRQEKETGAIGFDEHDHDQVATEVDLASWMDTRGAYRTVLERIVPLSHKQREVMSRCEVARQPLGDAAKEMGIQIATARVHLYRARQALEDARSQLQEPGVSAHSWPRSTGTAPTAKGGALGGGQPPSVCGGLWRTRAGPQSRTRQSPPVGFRR